MIIVGSVVWSFYINAAGNGCFHQLGAGYRLHKLFFGASLGRFRFPSRRHEEEAPCAEKVILAAACRRIIFFPVDRLCLVDPTVAGALSIQPFIH